MSVSALRGVPPRACRRRVFTGAVGVGALVFSLFPHVAYGQPASPRPLGRDLSVYVPSRPDPGAPGATASRTRDNPTASIALRDALVLALKQSPELASFAWELRAREAAMLQANRPPNPSFDVLLEDYGATNRGDAEPAVVQPQTTLQLSQLIELGGKRAARRQLAETSRDLGTWDFETARIDLVTHVTTAFVDVLASQQTVALTDRLLALAEQTQASVAARIAAGTVSPLEEHRTTVAITSVRLDAQRARRTLAAARVKLAALWGAEEAVYASVEGDLTTIPPVPAFDRLLARVTDSPELARWGTEMAQREAALRLARAARVPDVAVSGGYRRYTQIDSQAWVVGASVPLPLFNRNRAGITEAQDRVSKGHEEQQAAAARVRTALADAYRSLSSAQDEVTALRDIVLPAARTTFAGVDEGYRMGKFGYLDVLDTQRTLFGAEGQYLRALSDYHKAVADVERLIGAPLLDVAPSPPSQ